MLSLTYGNLKIPTRDAIRLPNPDFLGLVSEPSQSYDVMRAWVTSTARESVSVLSSKILEDRLTSLMCAHPNDDDFSRADDQGAEVEARPVPGRPSRGRRGERSFLFASL